ncbi:MAG: c-type cytochrome [Gemmataceae bacterium]
MRFVLVLLLFLFSGSATEVFGQKLSDRLKSEDLKALAKAARISGDAVRGTVLFNQKNLACTQCHLANSGTLLGPDLTRIGKETPDVYLVESLLYPSKVIKKGFETVTVLTKAGKISTGRVIQSTPKKLVLRLNSNPAERLTLARGDIEKLVTLKKSAMPADLTDKLNNRQEFLDLVKYLMTVAAAGPSEHKQKEIAGGVISLDLQGLVLMDHLNCAACHDDGRETAQMTHRHAPNLAWSGRWVNPDYLQRFISQPSKVKPHTTMPDMMAGESKRSRDKIAREITHYLVSLGGKTMKPQAPDRVAARRGRELFHSVGCVACHAPRDDKGNELASVKTPALGRLEKKFNVEGLTSLLENPHAARPSGRMPSMKLSHWEALDIAHYLLEKSPDPPAKAFKLDRTLAQKGKVHFQRFDCAKCHESNIPVRVSKVPTLSHVRTDRGCLSDKIGKWPRYQLDKSEIQAIRLAIARKHKKLNDEDRIGVTMTRLNCVACHNRGELGGVPPDQEEYFQTTDENLGRQGRIPPSLTNVGAKLKRQWLRDVLVSGKAIRPYMKTRMPQYGPSHVAHLVNLFQRVDQLPKVTPPKFSDDRKLRLTGLELVGDRGLNCIACHTYRLKRSATMPALDLTQMGERLQQDWFYHYMRDPQRFSPNTVMPSFWPGGKAVRKNILGGNTELQIAAIWRYLQDGRQAGTPRGLIRKPLEIVVRDEAVMLRRQYRGIGKRGIGVGYPNRVNIAFDSEQMRLAMIWKGKFVDPGSVWRGQGSGSVRPLGTDLLNFARGPEVDDANNPWRVDDGRPPLHRFKGYSLDAKQRPIFRYQFDGIDVEDYFVDVKEKSGATILRRTLTLRSTQGRKNVVFRAAVNKKIVSEGRGTFRVGDKLRIRVHGDRKAQIEKAADGRVLRIPFDVAPGKSRLTLDYVW